jgi:filamentous hemagglutinin
MQLSPQYALDFASAGLYASAGDSSRAMEHTVAGVTSRDYMRDVAMGVVGAAVAAVTVARPPLVVNPAMLDELAANGVKFTPQNVIATGKNANGQVVFLETGNTKSGLAHIIEEHGSQFAQMGISEAEIPSVVMKAVTEGKLIGYQGSGTGRPIYEITINGQPQRIAVTVGSNGYIVGANPKGSGK